MILPPVLLPPDRGRRGAALLTVDPGLAALVACPSIARALAVDGWLDRQEPYLHLPDYLLHEEQLGTELSEGLPARIREVLAGLVEAPLAPFAAGVRAHRRLLRQAALRSLLAGFGASPSWALTAGFGGEAFRRVMVGGRPVAYGIATCVLWRGHWSGVEDFIRSHLAEEDVRVLEAVLWPPVLGTAGEYAAALERWRALTPLRRFLERSPYPLRPPCGGCGVAPPPGYRLRLDLTELAQRGVPVEAAATLVNLYEAEVVDELYQALPLPPAERPDLWSLLGARVA